MSAARLTLQRITNIAPYAFDPYIPLNRRSGSGKFMNQAKVLRTTWENSDEEGLPTDWSALAKAVDGKFTPLRRSFSIYCKETDTHAMIWTRKNETIISFRGTSVKNYKQDLEVWQRGNVHAGFKTCFNSVSESIIKTIEENIQVSNVHVTGHSLGAAQATLMAWRLADWPNIKKLQVTNFGSPRVGDSFFAKEYNLLVPDTIRVVNANDVITRVPFIGYEHVCVSNMVHYALSGDQIPAGILVFGPKLSLPHHLEDSYMETLKMVGARLNPIL